jgi:hypothetical protein
MFASLYVCLATSSSPLIPDFVDGQLEPIVLQSSTYFDCIRPLVSQFEWLLRVCDVLVDVLVDKIPDYPVSQDISRTVKILTRRISFSITLFDPVRAS